MRIAGPDTKLTKAQVAGAVKRTVTVKGEDGKEVEKTAAVKADEVLDWCVYDDTDPPTLVVVTIAGEKLRGDAPAAKK